MTNAQPTRRTVAKAGMWTTPAVVVAAAAPAMASSECDPSTNIVERTVSLSAALHGSVVDTPTDGSVTYVNNGPDTLLAGTNFTFTVSATYNRSTGVIPTASPTILPSVDEVTLVDAAQDSDPDMYVLTFTVKVKQELAPGQSFSIDLNASNFGIAVHGDEHYGSGTSSQLFNDKSATLQDVIQGCQTIRTTTVVDAS